MTLPRQVVLDKCRNDIQAFILKTQKDNNLNVYDMESIMYQILLDYKINKETQYANIMLSMAEHINSMSEAKTKRGEE